MGKAGGEDHAIIICVSAKAAAPKPESNMIGPHDKAGAAKGRVGRAKWKNGVI